MAVENTEVSGVLAIFRPEVNTGSHVNAKFKRKRLSIQLLHVNQGHLQQRLTSGPSYNGILYTDHRQIQKAEGAIGRFAVESLAEAVELTHCTL